MKDNPTKPKLSEKVRTKTQLLIWEATAEINKAPIPIPQETIEWMAKLRDHLWRTIDDLKFTDIKKPSESLLDKWAKKLNNHWCHRFKSMGYDSPPSCFLSEWYESVRDSYFYSVCSDNDYIYLIYNYATGLYKIGYTSRYKERMQSLSAANGVLMNDVIWLRTEAGYDEAAVSIEASLHKYFASRRGRGEWFELTTRDVVAIRKLFYEIGGEEIEDNVKEHLTFAYSI